MKKLILLSLFVTLVLAACDGTFVTKNVLDSNLYEFLHAGKTKKILFELKEIRTMTRTNGFFKPGRMRKDVTFDYAVYASVSDGTQLVEIYELPCQKNFDLDDFVSEVQVKRSKKRDHFALAYKNETIGIFHSMKKVSFLADYPLNPKGFTQGDFAKLDFKLVEMPRIALKKHISGQEKLIISDKELHDVLIQLKPSDELNYELSFSIANKEMFQNKSYQEGIIKHCKKDTRWKTNALNSIKNRKADLSNEQYLSKLHAIGGMEEVVKEDDYQYTLFLSSGNIDYFKERVLESKISLSRPMREKLNTEIIYQISHPCEMSSSEIDHLEDYFELAEKFGTQNPFALFFKNYEKSTCQKYTMHDLNNELLFPSPIIGESDKRLWVNFVVKNFKSIPEHDRSWDYKRIEEHITCEQKRDLLLKYKKDIDTFDDMVVPECR
ncbi:MAG: hypothetical protein ACK5B9_12375 [Flavobacteriia bacterium]|jgi:hypothetical protein